MNFKILAAGLFILCSLDVLAEDISVDENDNIQNIIDNTARNGDTLIFEPGEYKLNLSLNKNISLKGRSTRDTIVRPLDVTAPIIVVNGAVGISIQNMSFVEGRYAIRIATANSGLDLDITNNAFSLGLSTTSGQPNIAIELAGSSINITNNVFYQNDVAVLYASEIFDPTITLKDNIFHENTIDVDNAESDAIGANCWGTSKSIFIDLSNSVKVDDPEFIDSDNYDFHLPEDSGCIVDSTVDSSVIIYGAYGGEERDYIPAPVEIKSVNQDAAKTDGKVTLSWDANNARDVAGYKVYYAESPLLSLNTLDERKNLSAKVVGKELTAEIDQLKITTSKPEATKLKPGAPGDQKLTLSWTAVENANGYNIYYTGREDNPIDVKNVTSYTLTGLTNNEAYTIWVEAYTQQSYYFQVVAYTDANTDSNFEESFFINADKQVITGELTKSDISNKISMTPEAIVAYPDLPNEGCFIATAAFGYYSSAEVMVLRQFRDQYLLKSEFGRLLVRWYYEHGPLAADVIRQSEFIKSIVRLALYPVIGAVKVLNASYLGFALLASLYIFSLMILVNQICRLIMKRI